MSLRDLATGAACAAEAGSSSSNPLANLANAILPTRASAATRLANSLTAINANGLTPEEEALIQGHLPPFTEPYLRAPHPPRAPLPPPTPSLADAFFKQPSWNRPVHSPHPYLQKPNVPTEVFEAAFRNPDRIRNAPHMYRPLPPMHLRPAFHSMYMPSPPVPYFQMPSHAPLQTSNASNTPVYVNSHSAKDVSQQFNALSLSTRTEDASEALATAEAKQQSSEETKPQESITGPRSSFETASWGDEFTSFENADVTALEDSALYDDNIYERFAFSGDVDRDFHQWFQKHSRAAYVFREQQKDLKRSAAEALEEGIRLRGSGRLTQAIQCFEEALNRPAAEQLSKQSAATAWYLLGISLAETDDDNNAIIALQEGISQWSGNAVGERREDNPHLWQSLIALAVSYTNELQVSKSLRTMSEWLDLWSARDNIDSESGIPASMPPMEDTGAGVLLEELIRAASQNQNDVDVFIVIGILHNLRQEFPKAAEAFRHAVTLRPNSFGLWNKLGATLANGGNSDEALRAYRKAVDINPSMIRAWVNVGTAYSNRGEFAKCARYYLKSISMAEEQEASLVNKREESMAHVWNYLRTSLTSMGRMDLTSLVDKRDLRGLRSHFNF